MTHTMVFVTVCLLIAIIVASAASSVMIIRLASSSKQREADFMEASRYSAEVLGELELLDVQFPAATACPPLTFLEREIRGLNDKDKTVFERSQQHEMAT